MSIITDEMVEAAARAAFMRGWVTPDGMTEPDLFALRRKTDPDVWRLAKDNARAASPEVVRGLVEALDAMQAAVKSLPPSAVLRLSDDLVTRFLRVDGRATAMLKAAKEAGL